MTASIFVKYVKALVYICWYIYACFPIVKSHPMRTKENKNTKVEVF